MSDTITLEGAMELLDQPLYLEDGTPAENAFAIVKSELERRTVLLRDIRVMHRRSFTNETWKRLEKILGPLTESTTF